MVKLSAFWILAFNACSSFRFFTHKTFMFVSFLFDIFNTFNIDGSIFLLKITLRNPNRANIMNPNIMAKRLIKWISRFVKIIVVKFFFIFTIFVLLNFRHNFFRLRVFLFLLIIRTFFSKFKVARICLSPEIRINVNVSSFHSSSLNIA